VTRIGGAGIASSPHSPSHFRQVAFRQVIYREILFAKSFLWPQASESGH
jgi:hypothetical protein